MLCDTYLPIVSAIMRLTSRSPSVDSKIHDNISEEDVQGYHFCYNSVFRYLWHVSHP